MELQADLIERVPWQSLIVLDACRADYFRKAVRGGPEAVGSPRIVRSAAPCTAVWLREVGPLLADRNALYFTANPVVDREVSRMQVPLDLVSVWRDHWAHLTPGRIPSVHPWAVNGVVQAHRRLGALAGRPCVVHYLQPHSPYIGDVPLKMSRWGRSGNSFGRACHGLPRPDRAARSGNLNWALLRRAYRANLRLVWTAALHLARSLSGPVVMTADHGEVLGEHGGRFGHECHWTFDQLLEVPWLPLPEPSSSSPSVQQKLEALGYA